MHFAIRYLTEYAYDAPVTDNLNALREVLSKVADVGGDPAGADSGRGVGEKSQFAGFHAVV
jgi:hypothetical protein